MKTQRILPITAVLIGLAAWLLKLPQDSRPGASSHAAAPDTDHVLPAQPRSAATPPPDMEVGELPPTAEVLWRKPSPLAPMAAFQRWAEDYTAQPAAEKIEAGVKAAAARRVELRRLIQSDPEQALAHAAPERVRRALPARVSALLEEKVDARGDLLVTAVTYMDGKLPEGKRAVTTEAELSDGRKYKAHTYGRREHQPTRLNVPVHGIAVDDELAVSELPGRVLEPLEVLDAKMLAGDDTTCPVSEQPTAEAVTETVLLVARDPQFYCGPGHAAEDLFFLAYQEAAGGGSGTVEPSNLTRAPLNWTTGTRRLLAVRVNFKSSDAAGANYHNLGLTDTIDIVRRISDTLKAWSYGRLNIPYVSGTGSWVTPTVVLSKEAKDYKGNEMVKLWSEVWDLLEDQGYSRQTYDYLLVLAGNAPITDENSKKDAPVAVSWGGLAMVGKGLSIIRANNPEWTNEQRIVKNVDISLHELGHNFGLAHASSMSENPDGEIFNLFTFEEYGDVHDNMGGGGIGDDYNARFKHWLRWLDNPSLPVTSGPGVFTLREHDQAEGTGIRGLQVAIPGADAAFFVEYRLGGVAPFTGNPHVKTYDQVRAYGAFIRLARTNAPKSWLLDATPETESLGFLDCTLLPGRTFSIGGVSGGAYITNLGADPVAGTLTVEVDYPVAGNSPPSGSIVTSSPMVGIGEKFIFTAEASDPDNDDLAYHWRIPQFDLNWKQRAVFPNKRDITVQFPETGPWTVECIVSDKHGGTVTLTKNVLVGANTAPTITAISDKTMDEDTTIYVPFTIGDSTTSPSALAVSFTSSDMSLIHTLGLQLTGTGANRTLGISPSPNRHGTALITVRVFDGALTTVEEFTVTVRPVTPGTTLVAAASEGWRYWAAAQPPAGDWKATAYNDSTWGLDSARFVYPAPAFFPAAWTALPAAPGRVTCYFRKTFTMPAVPSGTPTIRLLCDDGAVVYVNGIEVYRHNMPSGAISPDTPALTSVEGHLENVRTIIPINPAVLVNGASNLIAVEVHDSLGSRGGMIRDVLFDLEFGHYHAPIVISSFTDKTIIEDHIAGPYNFSAFDFESDGGPLSFAVTSSNEELVHHTRAKVAAVNSSGTYSLTLTPEPDAFGSTVITLKVSDGQAETWRVFTLHVTPENDAPRIEPVSDRTVPAGIPLHIPVTLSDPDHSPSVLTLSATSSSQVVLPDSGIEMLPGADAATRWLRLTPTEGIAGQTTITLTAGDGQATSSQSFILRTEFTLDPGSSDMMLVRAGAVWRYRTSPLPLDGDAPADFTAPGFDDSAWPRKSAKFYTSSSGSGSLLASPLRITTYFRTSFEFGDPSSAAGLNLRLKRDDGAAVYLNGVRVWVSNLPEDITPATLALEPVDGAAEEEWHTLSLGPEFLVPGENIVAVELHQSHMPASVTDADLTFDFEMTATPAAAANPVVSGTLIPPGDIWAYWDQSVSGANAGWRNPAADDSGWSRGFAPLGYGHGMERTVVNRYDGPYTNKSVLFRKYFDVADPAAYTTLHLFMQRDDGAVVYLNGVRVIHDNVSNTVQPSDPNPLPSDYATVAISGRDHTLWQHYSIDPGRLVPGRNFIAVSVHQHSSTENGLFFDLQLSGELDVNPPITLRTVDEDMQVIWSAAYAGWQLKVSYDLKEWFPATNSPHLSGAWLHTREPVIGDRGFFKLVSP